MKFQELPNNNEEILARLDEIEAEKREISRQLGKLCTEQYDLRQKLKATDTDTSSPSQHQP